MQSTRFVFGAGALPTSNWSQKQTQTEKQNEEEIE